MTLFDSHMKFQTGKGIYLQGEAEEINDKTAHDAATRAYNNKIAAPKKSFDKYYLGDSPTRIYRAKITRAWENDVEKQRNYLVDVRYEVTL